VFPSKTRIRKARDLRGSAAEAIHAASAIVAKVDVLQQWERSAALERVNRLVAVEAPRMLTYGVTHSPPSKGNFFENLHRARAASAR